MMNFKKLSLGLVAATILATPAMAQQIEPGAMGFYYPSPRYVTGGYVVRAAPGPGYYPPGYYPPGYYAPGYYPRYYYGNQFYPAPRVGAFATAPWDDGSYYSWDDGSYSSLGIVERQW
jgi:hypothetical protein